MHPCRSRGCKIIKGQSWRSIKNLPVQGWPQIFLQPLDLQECTVPHLKDLIHICLELEAQGHGVTFKVYNLGSQQPHLHSAYVVSVASQLHTTV